MTRPIQRTLPQSPRLVSRSPPAPPPRFSLTSLRHLGFLHPGSRIGSCVYGLRSPLTIPFSNTTTLYNSPPGPAQVKSSSSVPHDNPRPSWTPSSLQLSVDGILQFAQLNWHASPPFQALSAEPSARAPATDHRQASLHSRLFSHHLAFFQLVPRSRRPAVSFSCILPPPSSLVLSSSHVRFPVLIHPPLLPPRLVPPPPLLASFRPLELARAGADGTDLQFPPPSEQTPYDAAETGREQPRVLSLFHKASTASRSSASSQSTPLRLGNARGRGRSSARRVQGNPRGGKSSRLEQRAPRTVPRERGPPGRRPQARFKPAWGVGSE